MSDGHFRPDRIEDEHELLAVMAHRGWVVIDWIDGALARSVIDAGLAERRMNPSGRRQSGLVPTGAGRKRAEGLPLPPWAEAMDS